MSKETKEDKTGKSDALERSKREDLPKVEQGQPRVRAQHQTDEERVERERQQNTDPLYLEKTRPEDPSSRQGQLTRDNVNPNIPSGKPGDPTNAGGIVDPTSLGMPQGGVAPKDPMQPQHDQQAADVELPPSASINEPQTTSFTSKDEIPIPSVTSIDPTECTIGDDNFTLDVTGENFLPGSTIVFAGHDEPSTLNEDGTLSTGVNMSVWHGPDTVKVSVRNGSVKSNEVDFTFLAGGGARSSDPDDLEDEIDEAIESGEAKSISAVKPKNKKK